MIIIIVTLILIDSYIIIKNKDNDNNDENNVQNKDNNKKIIKKKQKKKNTITANKTLITDKTLTGEDRKKTCYIQTMKRLPCLICSINITFIKTRRTRCL